VGATTGAKVPDAAGPSSATTACTTASTTIARAAPVRASTSAVGSPVMGPAVAALTSLRYRPAAGACHFPPMKFS